MAATLHTRISDFRTLVGTNVAPIRAAGNDSWSNLNLNQREERIVYDYLSGRNNAGLHHLNARVPQLFASSGFEVKFAAVFCHGHPQVVSLQGKSSGPQVLTGSPCELGDLHLVFAFLDQAKTLVDQRSILFQVKKQARTGGASLINHVDQSYLYQQADGFEYTTMLSGVRQWPTYRERARALHYLFCGNSPATTSPASTPALIEFGELLFRFMVDSEGAFFSEPRGTYSAWWDVNWDLLKVVAGAYYKKTLRGQGISDVLSHFNAFDEHDHFFLDLGENGQQGIPTLFVIVRDLKLSSEGANKAKKPPLDLLTNYE
jgi:hypothetical protein